MSKREPAYLVSPDRPSQQPAFSREFLETVLESSYDGIYITDGAAVTIMVNKSYETISGLTRQEMLGQSMRDLVERKVISRSGSIAALEKREPVTLEQVFKTGKRAVITSTPIFNENHEIVMVVTNVRDVTEMHTLKEKVEKLQDRNLQYNNELESLRSRLAAPRAVVAVDASMREVVSRSERAATLDATVLLEGENGVGKQDLAQHIVTKSRRRKAPFLQVNCSAYAPGALEGELFGYAAGQLPGSPEGRKGIFELADGGSVLLDEVSELPIEVQMRLLQMMQGKGIMRVGASNPIQVDVRILATTSQDLESLVQQQLFRRELYYQLNTLTIRIPPLRERRDDILTLVNDLCSQMNKKYHQKKKFTQAALLAMRNYSWPGNLRELQNVVERAMIFSNGDLIDLEDLPLEAKEHPTQEEVEGFSGPVDLRRMVDEMELTYIRRAYQQYGNVREAARSLGLDPSTFVRKRKKLEEQEKQDLLQK